MRRNNWHMILALSLVASSALFYWAQILVFHNTHDTFFYMLQDLAFVPLQALLVIGVLDELLSRREKAQLQHKMNMVIGAFFSAVGSDLLKKLAAFDLDIDELREVVIVGSSFSQKDLTNARRFVTEREFRIDSQRADLDGLKNFLSAQRPFMLGLLENQNLLEHQSFTELLWAVCHLSEELMYRDDVINLSAPDRQHINADMVRAYKATVGEWLAYVIHLKNDYPYIFSLVLRMNPFDPNATPEIK